MADNKGDKTEKPTARKLRKAREEGQIARSREVPSAAVLIGTLLILSYSGTAIVQKLELEMQHHLRFHVPQDLTVAAVSSIFKDTSFRMALLIVPIMLAIVALSIGGNAAQGGFAFSVKALKFKFNKLNPVNGVKNVFSKNGLVQLAKSMAVITMVSIISWQVVHRHMAIYPRLILMDVRQLLYWTSTISYEILIRVAVLMAVLALADYAFQRYQFMEQMKMSKQEVKDEFKEMEGDPITKGRIRRVQREMARKRMMSDVPTADVVVTNPTHYAVALSYKMDEMAPKVVAKGVDFVAQRIKEIAREHNVPIMENKPLARALYKDVDVGGFIPADLYKAVAEILAYVYKAKRMF
ncbi:MAG: flagellar biosynthesis protein FlhB [Acidobacteriota bacterium]|jgi:flagellar biosynthetic protein FlhB|nr:flagellar biosynthesis protein FlhB [Acidobacteriota bacterium]